VLLEMVLHYLGMSLGMDCSSYFSADLMEDLKHSGRVGEVWFQLHSLVKNSSSR